MKNNALFCESCDTVASSDGKIHGKVSDKWIWLLLVVCGFANLLKAFNDTGDILLIIIISSVLTLVFWLVDLRELRAKGHEGLWRLWGLFVMPIYLFVRAARVTKNYTVAIGYLVLFIMLMSVNLGTGEVGNAVLDFFDRSGVGAALDNIVESEYVTMVKNGSLRSCPDHTVNEMVNAFLANPRWEYGVSEDGRKFVNIRGSFSYSGKNVRGAVQFLIEDESFSFNAFEINDLPQNMFLAMALMEKMCEAASERGSGGTEQTQVGANKAIMAEAPRVLASYESAFLAAAVEIGNIEKLTNDYLIFTPPTDSRGFVYTVSNNASTCIATAKKDIGDFKKGSTLTTTFNESEDRFIHSSNQPDVARKLIPNFFRQ